MTNEIIENNWGPSRCWCCGVPLNECKGDGIPLVELDLVEFWRRVEEIWPEHGGRMPSCGMHDSARFNTDGNTPDESESFIG